MIYWRRFCDLSDVESEKEPCEHRGPAQPLNDGVTGHTICLKPILRDCTCMKRRESPISAFGQCLSGSVIAGFYPLSILGLPPARMWEIVPRIEDKDIRELYAWAKTYSEREIPFVILTRSGVYAMIKERKQ